MTLRQTVMDGFVVFTVFIQPFLVALMGIWMLRDKGAEYAIYVVVGSGMTGLWSSVLFICGNGINIERWSGTLETLVGVPTSLSTIVFGKNLANVGQSFFSMIAAYVLTSVIFGYPIAILHPLAFVISLFLVVIAFISFGLVIAPVFVMNPAVQQWQNGLEFPVYLMSGFLFPIAMLPIWSVPVSYVLPTYWAARALHLSTGGGTAAVAGVASHGGSAAAGATFGATSFSAELILTWVVLIASSAVYLGLASILFKAMVRKAKADATLDME